MLNKSEVFAALQTEVNKRVSDLEKALDSSRAEMVSESKSTAGDKHETGRAMAQLEQEKLGRQVLSARELQKAIAQIKLDQEHTEIQYGSLVKTPNGWFFFSVGIGKLIVEAESVFCLTMTSPLGNVLKGKKEGDSIQFNGRTIEIESVC
ncbi:MAG: 3-oxoacyl-ACP synthase [Crocinitomicaceae bacterium]